MVNWMYFPQNRKIESHLAQVIDSFNSVHEQIDSETHSGTNNLESDKVLACVAPGLERIGYSVEKSKRKEDKIRVPVLFGVNGKTNLAFEVDGYSSEEKTVIEVEAGRAVVNYQFLKDFYEACMMQGVEFFCIAVRNTYRGSKDFEKVCNFFQTLYISNRIQVPLKGILIIGY